MANGTGHAKNEYLWERLNKQREENSCQSIRRLLQILQIALAKVNRTVNESVCVCLYVCVCIYATDTHTGRGAWCKTYPNPEHQEYQELNACGDLELNMLRWCCHFDFAKVHTRLGSAQLGC